jgi:Ca2+/H+ antiporter
MPSHSIEGNESVFMQVITICSSTYFHSLNFEMKKKNQNNCSALMQFSHQALFLAVQLKFHSNFFE